MRDFGGAIIKYIIPLIVKINCRVSPRKRDREEKKTLLGWAEREVQKFATF